MLKQTNLVSKTPSAAPAPFLNFVLPLPPTGTNHAYHTNAGRWYKDSKVTAWETECLWKIKGKVKRTVGNGPITVNLGFYDGDRRRRDIDGRIKCCLDLMTKAGVYDDDSLVTTLVATKGYDPEKPRLEIEVY